MKTENTKKLSNRMSRLIGHAESNKRMIEEGKYCIDVINQNIAVISALYKLNEHLLEDHLQSCVVKAINSSDKKKSEKVINEILEVLNKSKR